MSHYICPRCTAEAGISICGWWRAQRGTSIRDVRCRFCGGEVIGDTMTARIKLGTYEREAVFSLLESGRFRCPSFKDWAYRMAWDYVREETLIELVERKNCRNKSLDFRHYLIEDWTRRTRAEHEQEAYSL